jgi:K+-sensing histidine kinase KdpD
MLIQSSISLSQSQNFFSSLKILKHSLSTPITNLLVNLELLSQDPNLSKLKNNSNLYLKRSLLSINYLREITQQCDKFNDRKKFCKFNVHHSLREVIEICKNPREKGVIVPFLQLNGSEQLRGNKLYFQEAIICLLNNAFQSYKTHAPNKLVMLFANKTAKLLEIKVTDAGRGFLKLKDSGKKLVNIKNINSQGNGLRFTQEVIKNHFQGIFTIESQPLRGTTVSCSFPLLKQ